MLHHPEPLTVDLHSAMWGTYYVYRLACHFLRYMPFLKIYGPYIHWHQDTHATRLQSHKKGGWFGKVSLDPAGCSHNHTHCTAMFSSITNTSLGLRQGASMYILIYTISSNHQSMWIIYILELWYLEIIALASFTNSLLRSSKALMQDLHDVPLEIRVQLPQTGAIRWRAPGTIGELRQKPTYISSFCRFQSRHELVTVRSIIASKMSDMGSKVCIATSNANPAGLMKFMDRESFCSYDATTWEGSF